MSDENMSGASAESPLGGWGKGFSDCVARQPGSGSEVAKELSARFKTVVEHFGPAYDIAEERAEEFQKKYRRASIAVYILAVLAVLIISTQYIFYHDDHWIVAGEVIAIFAILLLFHLGKRREWHLNWVESRLEAEWLRNGLFVAFLSGGTRPGISRHWACKWVSDAPGVARVQEKWNNLPELASLRDADLPVLKDYMANVWLVDQQRYHEEKSKKQMALHRRISVFGEVMFWGTLVAAIVHLVPHKWYHSWHLPDEPVVNTLTLLAIGLPTIGAALTGLRSHFEYHKIASRSAMMADHLTILHEDLEKVDSVAGLKEIVRETETLMLQENSDWYFTIGMHHIEKG